MISLACYQVGKKRRTINSVRRLIFDDTGHRLQSFPVFGTRGQELFPWRFSIVTIESDPECSLPAFGAADAVRLLGINADEVE